MNVYWCRWTGYQPLLIRIDLFHKYSAPGRGLDDRVDMVFPTKDEVMLVQLELTKVNGEPGENERSAGVWNNFGGTGEDHAKEANAEQSL